jgi:sugar-specific transcriptional regulator TrmB
MDKIHKNLIKNLGFSDKKARIFTSLLQLGECEASAIAKKAGLKRTTVYNILPELLEEGYIKSTVQNGKKHFFIEDPNIVLEQAKDKAESIGKIIPDLKSMFSLVGRTPKITIFEGLGGLKEIYNDFLKSTSKGDKVLAYAGTRDHFQYIPQDFVEDYMQKRIGKNISLRLITGTSELTNKFKEYDKKELRQSKSTDSKDFDFAGETIIYGDKVAFISYRENFLGAIIESKEIAMMQKAVFNLLWDKLD